MSDVFVASDHFAHASKILQEDAVTMSNISKSFGATQAVDGLQLTIKRGETVALLGPNGAGKTTTINMLLGLLSPSSGSIQIFGIEPKKAIQHSLVGAMLQEGKMIQGIRVGEFLDFIRNIHPTPLEKSALMDIAGLHEIANRRLDRLSGGQSQRVKFAMAIAGNPDLLLLDEPTSAMDVESRREFWTSMRSYADAGHTILFATHYLEEAEAFASRVVIIHSGRIAIDGTIQDIQQQYGGKQMIFTSSDASDFDFTQFPGVQRYEKQNQRITLHTTDADSTIQALITSRCSWQDITITKGNLENIFLSLIHKGAAQ